MTTGEGTGTRRKKPSSKTRKPPPRWRRYLVQAELELPPPPSPAVAYEEDSEPLPPDDPRDLPPWQTRPAVAALGALCLTLLVATAVALHRASVAGEAAREAQRRAETATLRAYDSERALRIAPNPRSWSAGLDATLDWPEPPQLLQLYLPVAYSSFDTFSLTVDKVDQGRVLVVERLTPDSNHELRLSLNSSAFGPGEYRMKLQAYTWRGERVDAGWIRLGVRAGD